MHLLKHNIDKQIESNKGKNLFVGNLETLQFIAETVDAISKISKLDKNSKQILIDYATEKSLEEFCRINQFYSFDSESKRQLRTIYTELFNDVQLSVLAPDKISENHYLKLRQWLKNSNPFADKIYAKNNVTVTPVTCEEYDAQLQTKILQINIENLQQPVLDIGCGTQAKLVKFLRNLGIDAYGIDRCKFNEPHLTTTDWLEFYYEPQKWGTIISNLGFSNHFNHHHLREDGNFIGYGKTYMNILHSLKIDGSFHYAPNLPFIELYLNHNQYIVSHYPIEKSDYKATIIKRLK